MSARETHVTEFGLGICVGLGVVGPTLLDYGLRPDTVSCDGRPSDERLTVTAAGVPTCPRCAVLRDEALEGRLPARPVLTTAT